MDFFSLWVRDILRYIENTISNYFLLLLEILIEQSWLTND